MVLSYGHTVSTNIYRHSLKYFVTSDSDCWYEQMPGIIYIDEPVKILLVAHVDSSHLIYLIFLSIYSSHGKGNI